MQNKLVAVHLFFDEAFLLKDFRTKWQHPHFIIRDKTQVFSLLYAKIATKISRIFFILILQEWCVLFIYLFNVLFRFVFKFKYFKKYSLRIASNKKFYAI